jgi:hypothetical protein
MEKQISVIFEKIKTKFPNKKIEHDLLRYYFEDALFSFVEGDYEKAFLSGYKVIREPTVVDPRDYVNDSREGAPSTFSEIRTTLMHSSRKHHRTEVRKIKTIKPKLPKYSLEVIENAFKSLQNIC